MMSSILGLSSTEGNIERGEQSPAKPVHCTTVLRVQTDHDDKHLGLAPTGRSTARSGRDQQHQPCTCSLCRRRVWHPRWGEGMPSPSPRDQSARRKRWEVISADTSFLVPAPNPPCSRLLADPDNLDAVRWGPAGLVEASVPTEGFAPLGELHPLVGTDGLDLRTRTRGSTRTFFPREKCENPPVKSSSAGPADEEDPCPRPPPGEVSTICSTVCSGKSTICSTIRSEMRLPEECDAVDLDHDHEELERRRSAPRSAKRYAWETTRSALPPIVPLTAAQEQENAMDTESKRSWLR